MIHDCFCRFLGHLMRSGEVDAIDTMVGRLNTSSSMSISPSFSCLFTVTEYECNCSLRKGEITCSSLGSLSERDGVPVECRIDWMGMMGVLFVCVQVSSTLAWKALLILFVVPSKYNIDDVVVAYPKNIPSLLLCCSFCVG